VTTSWFSTVSVAINGISPDRRKKTFTDHWLRATFNAVFANRARTTTHHGANNLEDTSRFNYLLLGLSYWVSNSSVCGSRLQSSAGSNVPNRHSWSGTKGPEIAGGAAQRKEGIQGL
jgi:hypothetical protein